MNAMQPEMWGNVSVPPRRSAKWKKRRKRVLKVLKRLRERNGNYGWSRSLEKRARRGVYTLDHTRVVSSSVANELPEQFDWESHMPGILRRRVKDQGQCGCCYAFTCTSALGMRYYALSNGAVDVDLSPQYLMDCGPSSCLGNNAKYELSLWPCQGGSFVSAFCSIAKHGVLTEDEYPFHCAKGERVCNNVIGCDANTTPTTTTQQQQQQQKYYCSDPVLLDLNSSNRIDNIKLEIYQNGPVVAGFTATSDFVNFKGNGIYSDNGNTDADDGVGGHAIVIYGWGRENGREFWHILNSWSDVWGDDGIARVDVLGTNIGMQDVYGALPLLDDTDIANVDDDDDDGVDNIVDVNDDDDDDAAVDDIVDVNDDRDDLCSALKRLRERMQPGQDLSELNEQVGDYNQHAMWYSKPQALMPLPPPLLLLLLLLLVTVCVVVVVAVLCAKKGAFPSSR